MTAVRALGLAIFCAALSPASETRKKERSEIKEEISIKGKGTVGPPVQVPPPGPDKEVVGEVIRSLDIYKKEHKGGAPALKPAGVSRLSRPFPEPPFLIFSPRTVAVPYDGWVFEVLQGGEVVWRAQGEGRLKERIEWDGSGSSGESSAQAGKSYHFRFTGKSGASEFILTSEPVALKSLAYEEVMGGTRLEAANSALFEEGKSSLKSSAEEYLSAMGERLRRVGIGDQPYRFVLYQARPRGRLARERAESLRKYFSQYLFINPKRIEVDVLPVAERGDSTACVLPLEKGSSIRLEGP